MIKEKESLYVTYKVVLEGGSQTQIRESWVLWPLFSYPNAKSEILQQTLSDFVASLKNQIRLNMLYELFAGRQFT